MPGATRPALCGGLAARRTCAAAAGGASSSGRATPQQLAAAAAAVAPALAARALWQQPQHLQQHPQRHALQQPQQQQRRRRGSALVAAAAAGAAGAAPGGSASDLTSFLAAFWKFLRPHTIRGTILGTTAVVARALLDNPNPIDWGLLPRAILGLIALLCGNGYIVGINQVRGAGGSDATVMLQAVYLSTG